MVTAEQATQPDLEKRTRLLAAVLFVLGGLAIFAPLMAGANAESRVGLLLVIAAAIELYHGFRRSSQEGRRAAWQSGAVTVLMGMLVLNSDSLIFSAFLLFLGGWFAVDAVRYIMWGIGNRLRPVGPSGRGFYPPWAIPPWRSSSCFSTTGAFMDRIRRWGVEDSRNRLERPGGVGLHRGRFQPDDG